MRKPVKSADIDAVALALSRGAMEQHDLAIALGWDQHRTDLALVELQRQYRVEFDRNALKHRLVNHGPNLDT